MCMACEQAEMYFRWQLLEQIAKGEMPEGMSESDLRAMQLPLPGEVARFEEPDGELSRSAKSIAHPKTRRVLSSVTVRTRESKTDRPASADLQTIGR